MSISIQLHKDIIQGSPEWHELRAHRFGGTDASALHVGGKGMETLIYKKIAAKHFHDDMYDDAYVSNAMQRGNDLEPLAREEYETETFSTVEQVGYVSWGEWYGVSPDGLVGEDGAIEIKCPMGPEFIRIAASACDPPKNHWAQMQWLMFITDRKWCDYIMYHPDAKTLSRRIERNEDAMNRFAYICEVIDARIKNIEESILDVVR